MKHLTTLFLVIILVSCKLNNTNKSKSVKVAQDYIQLLKGKKWYYTDAPTGLVKYPNEYLMFDDKHQYYYANDVLESKDVFHFSDNCIYDSIKVGKVRFGGYMLMKDDTCYRIEVIQDSIFTFWVEEIGRFNCLEAK